MAPTSCFNGQVHRLPDAPEAYGAMITPPKAAPGQSRYADRSALCTTHLIRGTFARESCPRMLFANVVRECRPRNPFANVVRQYCSPMLFAKAVRDFRLRESFA